MRIALKTGKTPVQLFPMLHRDWNIRTLWGDAVPQILDELKPLGQW
jgi:hypothetical protein